MFQIVERRSQSRSGSIGVKESVRPETENLTDQNGLSIADISRRITGCLRQIVPQSPRHSNAPLPYGVSDRRTREHARMRRETPEKTVDGSQHGEPGG